MKFQDTLTFDGIRITDSGYGVISARVARGDNVQIYRGSELGMPDRETVRVFRPSDEVFKKDALATYSGIPVTMGHPKEKVTASNWKDLAVGEVGEDILRDGEFVRVPMMLRDARALKIVDAGTRELSMGYDAEITLRDGTSPDGEKYDAVMSQFSMNHVAIVPLARGGADLRIGDAADFWGVSPVTPKDGKVEMTNPLKMVVVGDEAVETTDAGARAIEKLKAQITAKDAEVVATKTAFDAKLAEKDGEIGALKAELKKAQDEAPKAADIDKMVADRADLVGKIRVLAPTLDVAGKSDADLRREAVKVKLGDDAIKEASDAEIAGMFRVISKDAKADPFRQTAANGLQVTAGDRGSVDDAHAKMVKRLETGYLNEKAH